MNKIAPSGLARNPEGLVSVTNGEARASSLAIAQGTGNEHRAVLQLVRVHLNDFEVFGRVAFEMQPFATTGGTQQREVALLNEPQATLLITFMRNSSVVVAFKVRLVKAFYDLKAAVKPSPTAILSTPQMFALASKAVVELEGRLDGVEARLVVVEAQAAESRSTPVPDQESRPGVETKAVRAPLAPKYQVTNSTVTVRDFAKANGLGKKLAYRWLRAIDCLDGRNHPTARAISRGWMVCVKDDHSMLRAKVTPHGQAYLVGRLRRVGMEAR